MNERLKELADKARDAVTKDMETFQDASMCQSQARWIELYNSKFAELIIHECLDLLWNSLSISADHVGTVDGIEYTGKEILTAAKEHFFRS